MTRQSWANGLNLERFRKYLHFLAQLHLEPQVQQRIDPSDVVQETLIKAYKSIDRFRGDSDKELAAWIRRILANTLADAIRQVHRGKRDIALERSLQAAVDESSARVEACLAADQSTPSEQVMREERLLQLAEAIADLPEDQRIALELHHLRGCNLADVAKQMKRSTPSVAGLIRRGLITLRKRLDSKG